MFSHVFWWWFTYMGACWLWFNKWVLSNRNYGGLGIGFGLGKGMPSTCLIKCLKECFHSIVELSLELLHGLVW